MTADSEFFAFARPDDSQLNLYTRLFRAMVEERRITVGQWNQLVAQYVDQLTQDPSDRAAALGNLTKELGTMQMSERLFLKGLRILKIQTLELTAKVTDEVGYERVYTVKGRLSRTPTPA